VGRRLSLRPGSTLNVGIVDLPFRIMTCRFLLAIVSHTWDLVCINLSFASKDFVCPRNNLDYTLHSVFSIGVDTTLSESRVVYR